MPLAKAIRAIAWWFACGRFGACVGVGDVPTRDEFMRVPREMRPARPTA